MRTSKLLFQWLGKTQGKTDRHRFVDIQMEFSQITGLIYWKNVERKQKPKARVSLSLHCCCFSFRSVSFGNTTNRKLHQKKKYNETIGFGFRYVTPRHERYFYFGPQFSWSSTIEWMHCHSVFDIRSSLVQNVVSRACCLACILCYLKLLLFINCMAFFAPIFEGTQMPLRIVKFWIWQLRVSWNNYSSQMQLVSATGRLLWSTKQMTKQHQSSQQKAQRYFILTKYTALHFTNKC